MLLSTFLLGGGFQNLQFLDVLNDIGHSLAEQLRIDADHASMPMCRNHLVQNVD